MNTVSEIRKSGTQASSPLCLQGARICVAPPKGVSAGIVANKSAVPATVLPNVQLRLLMVSFSLETECGSYTLSIRCMPASRKLNSCKQATNSAKTLLLSKPSKVSFPQRKQGYSEPRVHANRECCNTAGACKWNLVNQERFVALVSGSIYRLRSMC